MTAPTHATINQTGLPEAVAHDIPTLRLITCGSVDDGKSTLIGRLLYECGALYQEELELLDKERTADGLPDFSVLLDGLLSEREQSITIDVAYRTFTSATRRYRIADAPGHEQYTRNMVTGASHADAALVLVDAPKAHKGLLRQTQRHVFILSLMGVRDVLVAVNKMDACAYSQQVFAAIESLCSQYAARLGFHTMRCVPVSALHGDNLLVLSPRTPWYQGPSLFEALESIKPQLSVIQSFCMPVQWVARTEQVRALCGTVVSGTVAPGQEVVVLPSGVKSRVRGLCTFDGPLERAEAGQAISLHLEDQVDVARGDTLAASDAPPELSDKLAATVVWLNNPPLSPGRTYILRMGTLEALATVLELGARIDPNTQKACAAKELQANEIGRVKLGLNRLVPCIPYAQEREMGSFILIDRMSNKTLGAGMVEFGLHRSHTVTWQHFSLDKAAHAAQKAQNPLLVWFTGLSASGKSTLANLVATRLFAMGRHVYSLDGDNLRHGLNSDLGFTEADRAENIRRASEVAALMLDAGLVVLASFISPYRADRAAIRDRFAPGEFVEVFVDTPLEECMRRDPKGLYAKALAGEIPNFTGISAPFEAPEHPDLHLDGCQSPEALANAVLALCAARTGRE